MADGSASIEGVKELGRGELYEPADAARFLRMSSARVRRWVYGYHYEYREKTRHKGPMIVRDRNDGQVPYMSFLDLMELLFVKLFLDEGIPLQRIRRALDEAKQVLDIDHPFARRMFFTNGHALYLQVKQQGDAPQLLQLLSGGQWVIAPVVMQYARQIDFARVSGEALRWWPMGRAVPVVLDPRVSFGAPTIAEAGIRTTVLYDLYKAEGKRVNAVSRWMQIPPDLVRAAVRWEEQYLRKAA